MVPANIQKAQDIGKMFSGKALEIANARRIGRYQGRNIEGRLVDTSGDLALGLLLLDSVGYHIAQTYDRRLVKDKRNDPTAKRQGDEVRQDIRNGISRFTSEMHKFFYPEHQHTFVSTMNPWLVENMFTSRAIKFLLPMAITVLTSVASRRKGSWEDVMLSPVLDELCWYANNLIKTLPGKLKTAEGSNDKQQPEVIHHGAMKEFLLKHRNYVGPGTQANTLPIKPHEPSTVVSDYLGTKLNTVAFELSQLEEGDKLSVNQFVIVRFGGRGYMALRDLELYVGYQVQSEDFFLL